MSLLVRPTFRCHSKCGKVNAATLTALTFWLLLAVLIVQAQAGVIKKREIPLTKDLTTTAASTTATVTATTIGPTHDPDIEDSELSKTKATTPQPPTPKTLAELQTNDTEVTKLTPMGSNAVHLESSKEYMLNEIALNETKKLFKTSDEGVTQNNNNKKELEMETVNLAETLNKTEIATNSGLKVQGFGSDTNLNPGHNLTEPRHEVKDSTNPEHVVKELGNVFVINPGNTITDRFSKEKNLNKPVFQENLNETAKALETSDQEGVVKQIGNGIALEHNEPGKGLETTTTIQPEQGFKELGNGIGLNPGNTLNEQSSKENILNNPGKEETHNEENQRKGLETITITEPDFKGLGNNDLAQNSRNNLNEHSSKENILNHNETTTNPEPSVKEFENGIGLNADHTLNVQSGTITTTPESSHTEFGNVIGLNSGHTLNVQSGTTTTTPEQSVGNGIGIGVNSNHESPKENLLAKSSGSVVEEIATTTIESPKEEDQSKSTNLAVKDNSIEPVEKARPSTLPNKDDSLETNHISDVSKPNQDTTEMMSNKPQSTFSNSSDNTAKPTIKESSGADTLKTTNDEDDVSKTTLSTGSLTNHTLKIQDGLDKESWKDVSNDLPEQTTQQILTDTNQEGTKHEYGRSMFGGAEKEEATTLLTPTTPNPHIANNIDLEDVLKAKKPKFLNDNATNAQQMNLPNNAEVWSLAGLKSLPTVNATMETAPKQKVEEKEGEGVGQGKEVQQIESPLNKPTINSRQSEKSLLDWSNIVGDKELGATATLAYQATDNNEVAVNNNETEVYANAKDLAQLEESKQTDSMTQTTIPSTGAVGQQESVTSTPYHSTTTATITANSSTILSSGSDNEEGDKHETPKLASASASTNAFNSNSAETSTLATEVRQPTVTAPTSSSSSPSSLLSLEKGQRQEEHSVASPKSVITHEQLQQDPDLNEINLTLNKTITTVDFTEPESNGAQHNHSAVTEAHSEREGEGETNTATAVTVDTTSKTAAAVEQLSTLESGKANATDNIENNTIFDKSQTNTTDKGENDNGNIELQQFATSSISATADVVPITTYKPIFSGLATTASDTTIVTTTPITTTTTTAANKIPIAEVVDQNGNEIEQKQSINVETTTTTTTETETGSFNNNFSSTIKTHLNEQVSFETTTELIATTTTATTTTLATTTPTAATHILTSATTNGTSEKTTSSSTDEIISNGKEEFQLETFTTEATPKNKDYDDESSTTNVENDNGEEAQHSTTTAATSIVIGSSTPPPTLPPLSEKKFEKEQQQEIEAATTFETPVVGTTNKSFATTPAPFIITTTTVAINETVEKEEEEKDTTTKVVDTYFKFPVKGINNKEPSTTTTLTTKEDDKEIETSTMSLQTPSTYTPTLPTTTAKEETYISLLDDSTTTTTTTTTTTEAPTTTAAAAAPPLETTAASLIPPTTTTTTTTTAAPSSDIDITSKIEEIYKVIVSSSTETIPTTSASQEEVFATTTRILYNSVSETPTTPSPTMFERPVVTTTPALSPAPTVIAADIGGGSLPPLNTIMGGNSGNMYPKNSEASGETDVNVIIAITVSVIGVIALLLLVAFLYLMRKRQKQTSYSQRCRPVSLDEYAIGDGSVGGSMRKGSVLRSSKRTYGNLAFDDPSIRHNAMGVHELAKFAGEKLRIFEEFRDVPQITAREDEVPQGCEDRNRYANVLPLPETRVVLQRLSDDEKTEYINANYVTGPKDAPNYYIACQAPLDTTVEDFWRMIWEQQSRVIIQATDLIENGVEKCAEYLPPSVTLDNHSTFGDFQVTLQNREVKDKYAISTVLLKHTGQNNATRELTHYWYKWPETGVPTEEAPIIAMLLEARSSLISYAIEQANEDKEKSSSATLKSAEEGTAGVTANGGSSTKETGNVSGNGGSGEINGNISMVPLKKTARNQGPLTIHCSPGTGRTGTIIACDIALRSLETPKRTVDIPHIVYYVRRGRASAVLTKEQYEFIYKVANMYGAKISNPTTYN